MIMAILFQSEILKFNPIKDRLNGFCNSFNLTYKNLDSKGNVSQLLVKILPNINRAERYLP